ILFFFITRPPPNPTLFPYTTLFRSDLLELLDLGRVLAVVRQVVVAERHARDRRHAARSQQLQRDQAGRIGLESQVDEVEPDARRSEEHTSELQSLAYLVCRLLLEKK